MAGVMTGMGQDGLRGAADLHAKGAAIFAQDEASSVVWGMPGAVASAGLADRIVPLKGIAGVLTELASAGARSYRPDESRGSGPEPRRGIACR